MTVAELIERLKDMPPDLRVAISVLVDHDGDMALDEVELVEEIDVTHRDWRWFDGPPGDGKAVVIR